MTSNYQLKANIRREIEDHVAEFIKNGGEIQLIATGIVAGKEYADKLAFNNKKTKEERKC